jgi:hypothetical protein
MTTFTCRSPFLYGSNISPSLNITTADVEKMPNEKNKAIMLAANRVISSYMYRQSCDVAPESTSLYRHALLTRRGSGSVFILWFTFTSLKITFY